VFFCGRYAPLLSGFGPPRLNSLILLVVALQPAEQWEKQDGAVFKS
jgi:hypothetical protein